MAYQGFVFYEETSHLSDQAFLNTLKCLDVAANTIKLHKHLTQIDPTAAFIFNPDALWHPAAKVSYSLPTELRAVPPRKFGEIGWQVDEAIVNDDTYVYQQIISLMYENGLIDYLQERLSKNSFLQIVEIGGGYGALAYYLTRVLEGHVHYALIDLPESLASASIYCSTLFPDMGHGVIENTESFALPREPGFTFIPNTLYHNLCVDDRLVALCINTGSMAEMSATQVNDYCESIGRFMGVNGRFFEQTHSEYPLDQEKSNHVHKGYNNSSLQKPTPMHHDVRTHLSQ